MLRSLRTALERLRRPEYTGENRCAPCTVVNLLVAAGLALLAGRVRRSAGVLVFAVGAALVGLRGYLVPGTPALTKRYLPDRLLAAFDKAPARPGAETLGPVASPGDRAPGSDGGATDPEDAPAEHAMAPGVDPASDEGGTESADAETEPTDAETETNPGAETDPETAAAPEDAPAEHAMTPGVDSAASEAEATPVDPERALLGAGAVEPTPSGDDLELTAEFEAAWLAAAEDLRGDRDAQTAAVADLLGAESADAEDDEFGVRVTADDGRTDVWVTEGALLADAAAHRVLRERDPWPAVGVEQRLGLLRALRSFLSTCPRCGGDVSMTEDAVESCCRQWDVLAVRCADCGEHYLELNPADVGVGGGGATGVGPTRG